MTRRDTSGRASRTTITDVARRALVSAGTVSNVLNSPELVAEDTRQRVLTAIEELGFVRNHSARQLRSGKSVAIGLVLMAMDDFFSELARGVEEAANEAGCLVILCNSSGNVEREQEYLRLLAEQRVRGVLISPVQRDTIHVELFRQWKTPLVFLLGSNAGTAAHSAVAGDFERDAELAIEHLLGLGHRRIGFINGSLAIEACARRHVAVQRALVHAGLDLREALLEVSVDAFDVGSGEAAAADLLSFDPPPTAIFGVNDMVAIGALRALLRLGIAVPDEVAVIGVGDVEFAAVSAVPLTTVRYPAYEIGKTAAELLIRESEGTETGHRVVRFAPELVVRESTVPAFRRSDRSRRRAHPTVTGLVPGALDKGSGRA